MMKTILLIPVVSIVFIAGCTAGGPVFSPVKTIDANKAVVYIYRPFSVCGSVQTPTVYIDEVKYGPIKNKGYLVYFVEPGKRMVEVRDWVWDKPLTIYPDLEAGRECYIRFFYEYNWGTIKMTLAVIPPEYAQREIASTRKAD
jgi:hypothetical protein